MDCFNKDTSQQGGWSVECDPQTQDLKAAKQPTHSEERRLETSTNYRDDVGLANHPGRGEQEWQALHYLGPSLLVFGWNITTVWCWCDSCRVLFVWRNTASICPVMRLHLHVEHGGEALLIFLRQKHAHGETCCCCETCPGCVLHRGKGH